MNIWTFGDAVVDLLPLADMQYRACAGGAPFNVAVGCARFGYQSGFIGRVGDDAFGYFLQRTLNEYGVTTQHLQMDSQHRTSTVLVSLGQDGEREFTFLVNPSADQFVTPEALPEFSADILHFCSLALVATQCRQTLACAIGKIKQAGGLLSFDVNLREQMWPDSKTMLTTVRHFALQADILKLSEEEWYWLVGTREYSQAIKALKMLPASLKVITFGAKGALVLWRDQVIEFGGYTVESVDTTGAGDGFVAGLLASIAEGKMPKTLTQLQQTLAQASACGALVTTQKGALAATPDRETVRKFIARAPLLHCKIKTECDGSLAVLSGHG